MSKLEKALEEALRWKIALDAANKGARRKSRQARLWRERHEQAEIYIENLQQECEMLRGAKDDILVGAVAEIARSM